MAIAPSGFRASTVSTSPWSCRRGIRRSLRSAQPVGSREHREALFGPPMPLGATHGSAKRHRARNGDHTWDIAAQIGPK